MNCPPDAPGRVLVVDDDPAVRRFVHRVLTGGGHAVDVVESVSEALSLLPRGGYDVALVDLDMPGRGGLDLLADLPATGADVVPVLLTGTTNVTAAVTGMKRGAFDYLPKPADPEKLRWTVGRAVEVARGRRREKALERVVGEWTATFDACPDRLLVLDAAGRVLRANRAVGGPDPVGKLLADVLPGPLVEAVRAGKPATVSADGRHHMVSVDPVAGSGGVIVVVRDVTELVEAQTDRAKLTRQLLTAQEDERGRLARELHDGVGQGVVSLAIGLGSAADAADGAQQHRLRELSCVAIDTLDEIRRIAHGLRPAVLDDLGLVAALERLAERFTHVHRVRAELVVPAAPVGRLPRGVESAVYRIVQEALANVAKHAKAGTVDVTLEVDDGTVHVAVTDDGSGLSAAGGSGMGLADMRERAAMLNGTMRVGSESGRGTTVEVRIPLPAGEP